MKGTKLKFRAIGGERKVLSVYRWCLQVVTVVSPPGCPPSVVLAIILAFCLGSCPFFQPVLQPSYHDYEFEYVLFLFKPSRVRFCCLEMRILLLLVL